MEQELGASSTWEPSGLCLPCLPYFYTTADEVISIILSAYSINTTAIYGYGFT